MSFVDEIKKNPIRIERKFSPEAQKQLSSLGSK